MARAMGLSDLEEWQEYSCPGAYRLPPNPNEVWADEWLGWDDWLGTPYSYEKAQEVVRAAGLRSEQAYHLFKQVNRRPSKSLSPAPWTSHARGVVDSVADNQGLLGDESECDLAERLPAQPDRYYKREWQGWGQFLGQSSMPPAPPPPPSPPPRSAAPLMTMATSCAPAPSKPEASVDEKASRARPAAPVRGEGQLLRAPAAALPRARACRRGGGAVDARARADPRTVRARVTPARAA